MEETYYQEIQPERDISGLNFSKGEINYNWTMDSRAYFNPYRSYIRMRCKLTDGLGNQLSVDDGIAPNMFLFDNLFQSMKVSLDSVELSSIGDYVPQIASLKNRMFKSEEHLNTYGATTNFAQAYHEQRLNEVCSDGCVVSDSCINRDLTGLIGVTTSAYATGIGSNFTEEVFVGDTIVINDDDTTLRRVMKVINDTDLIVDNVFASAISNGIAKTISHKKQSRRVSNFEIIAKPCLGFFDVDGFICSGSGMYNLRLTPQTEGIFQKYAIESLVDKSPTTDYKFEIESMNLYILKGLGSPVVDKNYNFVIKEIQLQSQNITTSSLTQKTFQVHPNTNELTLAFQTPGAGFNDTSASASKLKAKGDELNLERYWIQFGGKQLPQPIPDIKKEPSQDFFTQRYNETLQYTGGINTKTSYEPIEKWFERGVYFHHSGYGMGHKPDRVYISHQFKEFNDISQRPNVLLFNNFTRKVSINVKGSRLANVSVE